MPLTDKMTLIDPYTCAPISEIPSNIYTMGQYALYSYQYFSHAVLQISLQITDYHIKTRLMKR